MTYTSIMVGLDLGDGSRGRTKLAAHLAETFQARLIGVAARRPDYAGRYGEISVLSESGMDEIRRFATDDLVAAEDAFREVAGEGRSVEWRSAVADPGVFLEEQSRAADLVVIGRTGDKDPLDYRMSLDAGVALMALGRPVLVVPPEVNHLSATRVVVGWKNTLQSRRAISDAMPLLKRAEQVRVVRIAAEDDKEDLADVVQFLGLHDVNAVPSRWASSGVGIAEALQRAANDFDADLIVSGAYGHNRVREWFFGGVTRALLDHCPICCLMSH
ncbi:universal stress protein [Methylobacterium sp. CM6247]